MQILNYSPFSDLVVFVEPAVRAVYTRSYCQVLVSDVFYGL